MVWHPFAVCTILSVFWNPCHASRRVSGYRDAATGAASYRCGNRNIRKGNTMDDFDDDEDMSFEESLSHDEMGPVTVETLQNIERQINEQGGVPV